MERISFTRPSAERIARVVRVVENARPGAEALRARRIADFAKSNVIRIATFTGSWQVGATKDVTFKYKTTTPNTASVLNLFFPITRDSGQRDCSIAKEGTSWFLIDTKFGTATAVFVTGTTSENIITGITLSGAINTSNCSVSIGRTLTTSTRVFATSTATATYLFLE